MDTRIVLITLVIYKIILIGIGLWAQRRTGDNADFFLGGRGLGPVVAAISYGASAASAWTLLGISGIAYVMGVSAIWLVAGAVIGCIVAWLWVAPRMMRYTRAHDLLTVTAFLAHGSTGALRALIVRFCSLIILVSFIFYIASQFQGAGNTFDTTFGLGPGQSIALGGFIIMLYTLLGGFWAVSLTDTLQGLLMLFTALLLPIAALFAIGGWAEFVSGLQAVSNPAQLALTGANTGWLAAGFVAGSLAIGVSTFGQPHLLTRFMALRDRRALHQAQVLAIAWFSIVFGGMCFLGLAGRILVPSIDNPETLFFQLTIELFNPWISAILLAAVLSAIMSTADSMLLVAASAVSWDMGLARRFPGRELWVSRAVIAVICALAIVVAIALPATIFERVLFAWVAIGSAFGPLLFVRLGGRTVRQGAAAASIITGFCLAVTLYFVPVHALIERLLPFGSALALLLLWPRPVPGYAAPSAS